MNSSDDILQKLLAFEMNSVAYKLGFIEEFDAEIDSRYLMRLVGLVDRASRRKDAYSARVVVMVCALLWSHCPERRADLVEIMVLMLTRVGYSVSGAMIDEGFDRKGQTFSPISSWFTECSIAVMQAKSEVTVGSSVFLLTQPQKNIWDKMDKIPVLGVSAPTSAGKSYVITLKCIQLLLKKPGLVVYIVPTLSLVSQVSLDFHRQLREFGLSEYRISTTYNSEDLYEKTIYVFTQEKAMAAFSQKGHPFPLIRALIVDEIQNIERVGADSDQRAKRLYDAIIEFRHHSEIDRIVISGPRISGLKELGVEMFGMDADSEEVRSSPVASLTYSLYKRSKGRYIFRQYSDLLDDPIEIEVSSDNDWRWFGQATYTEDFHQFLSQFINRLGGNSINIIFSPTSTQARKTALQIASESPVYKNGPEGLPSLVSYLKSTVHVDYDLCNALEKGVAYHHGKVPSHARRAIEYAIKDRQVSNVVCTTTLMQGVNLPAQNIIIRSPKLFVRKQNGYDAVLTNYELANLRGRAGRLFKDLLGRAFVLEENSFSNEDEQPELFRDEHKELQSGYGSKFTEYKDEVEEVLVHDERPSPENKNFAYIVTYIRQAVLRFGDRAEDRLRTVGIFIDSNLRLQVQRSLENLTISKDVCFRNRYWDPFDLDVLDKEKSHFSVPTNPRDFEFSEDLTRILRKMKERFPYYCDRYFDVPESEGMTKHFAILASDWMKERPLSDILKNSYYSTPERIEKAIEELEGPISYGIPGLLKPVYDVVAENSMVPRFMEAGAYRPFTRFLIEENIPRETALRIASVTPQIWRNKFGRRDLPDIIKSIAGKLDFWDLVQVEVNR